MTFINFLMLLDFLVPLFVYVAVLVAAMRTRSSRGNRVAQSAMVFLITFVASIAIRYGMTAALPAVQLATWIPILNLGRTILMMAGIILIASAALAHPEDPSPNDYEPGRGNLETGNPYSPL